MIIDSGNNLNASHFNVNQIKIRPKWSNNRLDLRWKSMPLLVKIPKLECRYGIKDV